MKEVIITKYGSPEVLQIRERPTPIPKSNQVLVRNHFTGVNFSEIMARMRLYPGAPKPLTKMLSPLEMLETASSKVSRTLFLIEKFRY